MCQNCKPGDQPSPLQDGVVWRRLTGGFLQVQLLDGSFVQAADRSSTAYPGAQVSVAQTQNGWRVL